MKMSQFRPVTIVLSIIFGVSIIPYTAFGALYFNLENADVPTLYQEVRVKIQKGTPADEAKLPKGFNFEAKDEVYFVEDKTVKEGPCKVNISGSARRIGVKLGSDGTAEATVVIKNPEFSVGKTYMMCYIKKSVTEAGLPVSKVYEASYKPTDEKVSKTFTVQKSMFTGYTMTPSIVFAGQGPVVLSIAVADHVAEKFAEISQKPYLIPCSNGRCSKDDIASLCSSNDNKGAVTTGVVSGFGTGKLSTTFFAPVKPAKLYRVCVPYCFKAGSCESVISWALVDSYPIKLYAANPSLYTLNPSTPHAGELIEITFTGTGLSKDDKIRILAKGELCTIASTSLWPKIEFTEVTAPSPKSSVFKFRINDVLAEETTGQVCYSRKDTPTLWAPVYKTAGETESDLVITPMQPTNGGTGTNAGVSGDKGKPTTGVKGSTKEKSAADMSSTIPAVLITSVVFLYLYNW